MNKILISSLIPIALLAWTGPVSAHQPRIADSSTETTVQDPEISKAFYGELTGTPESYHIDAKEPFSLYASLAVPDIEGADTDFVLEIFRNDDSVDVLDGTEHEWTEMYEPFGGDRYLSGPEYRGEAEAGEYRLVVSSPDNNGKYVLATGEIESFPFAEIVNSIVEIPKLKKRFFGKTRAHFALSIFGGAYLLLTLLVGLFLGYAYRKVLRKISRRPKEGVSHPTHRNIGRADRLMRLALGLALLVVSLLTWHPLAMVASGFLFYEAAAGWCAFHAAIGRNTCPIS